MRFIYSSSVRKEMLSFHRPGPLEFSVRPKVTGKNNGFPFLDILGYLKNTHKNPKFGKVRQVPIREFPTKFPDWDFLTLPNLGFSWVFFKYPKISKNGNPLFFSVTEANHRVVGFVPSYDVRIIYFTV